MRRRWQSLHWAWRTATVLAFLAFIYALPDLNEAGVWPINVISTDYAAEGSAFDDVLVLTAIYVLVAVGLNVVIGLAGLLDLGYIGFFAVGAYSVAIFGSPTSDVATAYPWLMLIPIAIALAMVSGVILGLPTLRLRGDYLAIVTLGFGEIIRIVATNVSVTNGKAGIHEIPRPPGEWPDGTRIFGILDSRPMYWLCLTMVVICILGVKQLENSRVGRSWLAVREDEDAASLMGVPAFRFKIWAFAIGAAVGGLSGALYASKEGSMTADSFPLLMSILFVAMVVMGGQGNTAGVIVGAVTITYIPERLRFIADERFLVFGLALVLVMIFRPQGLIPSRRRAAEMADMKAEAKEVNVVV
ncbi:branched-chain amino acid ABC transporter permease [Stackebrandtia soli]|uniref:branched-chain amino acid ABC transporter permease n=1 Tax=Stackebrandtia soli TaxID=1892856 RepID=UPI0039EA95A2